MRAGDNPLVATPLPQSVETTLSLVVDKTFRISWALSQNAESYRVLENADGVSGFTDISWELGATTTSVDHRVALFASANAQYVVQSMSLNVSMEPGSSRLHSRVQAPSSSTKSYA